MNLEYSYNGMSVTPDLEKVRDPKSGLVFALPDFASIFDASPDNDYTIAGLYGGRISGMKSNIVAAKAVHLATNTPGLNIYFFRERQNSLRESAFGTVFAWVNHMCQPYAYPVENEYGEVEYKQDFWTNQGGVLVGQNGSKFTFRGCSKSHGTDESLKSLWDCHLAVIEEAQQISDESWEVLIPSVLRTSHKTVAGTPGSKVWIVCNPRSEYDPVWSKFISIASETPKYRARHVHYWENPYIPEQIREEIESDRKRLPKAFFANKWLGALAPMDGENPPLVLHHEVMNCYDFSVENPDLVEEARDELDFGGFDISTSSNGDNCAYAHRSGGVLENFKEWPGQTFRESCQLIRELNTPPADTLFYDGTGVGAGFGDDLYYSNDFPTQLYPIFFGGKVEGKSTYYTEDVKNDQFFINRGAQLYWTLKLRIENTLKFMSGEDIPLDRCFFINPRIPREEVSKFASQASLACYREVGERRIKVDKRRKGYPSPDILDAISLSFSLDSEFGLTTDFKELTVPEVPILDVPIAGVLYA